MSRSICAVNVMYEAEDALRREHYNAIPDDLEIAADSISMLIESLKPLDDVLMVRHSEFVDEYGIFLCSESVDAIRFALARVRGSE